MTIAQAIERWHQRQAERPGLDFVPAAVALTPRGDVAVAISRLRQQLRRLDDADRAVAVCQLRDLLADLAAPATA